MVSDRNAERGIVRMFQDMVAAAAVMNKKTCSLQGTKDNLRLESRQAVHAISRATFIFSFTGSWERLMSDGMGSPSLRKLSR